MKKIKVIPGYSKSDMLVISRLTAMVSIENKTPREAIDRVDQIKDDIFFALCDLKNESEDK